MQIAVNIIKTIFSSKNEHAKKPTYNGLCSDHYALALIVSCCLWRLADDSGFAVRTYGYNLDGRVRCLFDVGNVVLERFREILLFADVREGSVPSGEFLVDGLPAFSVVGHVGGRFAVLGVGGAYLDGGESVEHVSLHHHEVGHTVDHDRILQSHEVEPTATTVTACHGTIFVADVADGVACLVEKLNGERTTTHAGAVGLEDTEYVANRVGGYAQTGANAAAGGA